jgi:mono/diheme cytochrome c family protein/glucose/arabinose dehydrogenase
MALCRSRPVALVATVLAAASLLPLSPALRAQIAGRGAIQTPGGGRGPGAAPDANDPANAYADLSPRPPVVALSPEEQAKQFWLPPGYRLEPVLSDPVIEDPAAITFDGNGRMFVVELRGYFETPEGIDAIPPIGRISMHEDRDGDGTYERHTVFVDHLVFPRFATPFGANSILTMETNTDDVWKYTDTNGDGVADKKELFVTNFGRAGGVESQPSSLFWAMDNWLYSTVNAFRLRWTPNGILKEPTGPNGAQWGVTQDNAGKVWFQHGASGMPGYFQFPVHYGNFAPPDQFEPDLNIVWGAPILVGDIQAGLPGTRIPDGSLIYGTAAAGNEIYRGDRLPKDLIGDYLYGEVVARIVRRLRPVEIEGLTQLQNVYRRSEFIRSLDPLFRPVDIATSPDGTLYLADMYRGMMEGAEWAREGTYLRRKINQYQLDKVMHHGRIWRLTYAGMERDRTPPRMLDEKPAQLVTHLSHPNGWWRDTAQQLIVLKQDKSVVSALQSIVRTSRNPLARFHALWTLEGLGALTASLTREMLGDPDPQMRIEAIRASESLYKAGDKSLAVDYRALATSAPVATTPGTPQKASEPSDTDVVIQSMLTMNELKVADAATIVKAAADLRKARGVQFVADRILNAATAAGRGGRGGPVFSADEQSVLERGGTIYNELCFSCHGEDGRGTPTPGAAAGMTQAPPLAGSPRVNGHRDYIVKAILHGLSGPIEGRSFPQVMVAMGANKDEWVADVASYVRNSFGNSGVFVTVQDVGRVRASTADRKTPWTADELDASVPRPLVPDPSWKATASHESRPAPVSNAAGNYNFQGSPRDALGVLGWSTGVPQQEGMWFQIELPAPVLLTEVQFGSLMAGGGRSGPPIWTFPRAYQIQLSADGTSWSAPVASGQGREGTIVATFAPASARFVRITETATTPDAPAWGMRLLRLYSATARGG